MKQVAKMSVCYRVRCADALVLHVKYGLEISEIVESK